MYFRPRTALFRALTTLRCLGPPEQTGIRLHPQPRPPLQHLVHSRLRPPDGKGTRANPRYCDRSQPSAVANWNGVRRATLPLEGSVEEGQVPPLVGLHTPRFAAEPFCGHAAGAIASSRALGPFLSNPPLGRRCAPACKPPSQPLRFFPTDCLLELSAGIRDRSENSS